MVSFTSSLCDCEEGDGVCGRAGEGRAGGENIGRKATSVDSEEGAAAVIKCPAGPWQGLPRPQAMLMSMPSGQGYFISAHWTIRC